MRKVQKLTLVVMTVAVLGMVCNGFAQVSTLDLDTGEKPVVRETTMTAGLGLAVLPEYEGSEDYKAAPVPYFRSIWASGQYAQLLGTTLSGNVLANQTWQAGPLLRYRAARNDVKNDRVDAMAKVDAALELGGFVGYQYNHWSAKFEAAQDLADGHDGFLMTLTGGYTLPLAREATLTLNLSTTYADEDYMQAYFGVDAADHARSGLKQYDAEAGFKDLSATALLAYRFTPQWGLLGAVRLTSLLGDAADSPVVDDEGSAAQLLVGVVATYTF